MADINPYKKQIELEGSIKKKDEDLLYWAGGVKAAYDYAKQTKKDAHFQSHYGDYPQDVPLMKQQADYFMKSKDLDQNMVQRTQEEKSKLLKQRTNEVQRNSRPQNGSKINPHR